MTQKRSRKPKAPAQPSKKRRKVGQEPTKEQSLTEEVVNIDALNWQTVEPPDILEDAEGFYGLEEIEGVDIVRPAEGTQMKFMASKNSIKRCSDDSSDTIENLTTDDGEDWEGFSDSEPVGNDELESNGTESSQAKKKIDDTKNKKTDDKSKAKANKEKKEKKERKEKNEKKDSETEKEVKQQTSDGKDVESSIPFSVLSDEADEGVDVSAWDGLDLHPELQTSLSRLKFSKPTPIQTATIPEILAGRDVIGKAATGSGKTLAFGLPILQYYLDLHKYGKNGNRNKLEGSGEKKPIALILSPTRELAHQLVNHLKEVTSSAPHVDVYIASVTGGLSVYKQQRQLLNADIIIGTPGRLWDVVSSTPKILTKLKGVKFLVVDEADRLLSEGHFKEVGELLSALDKAKTSDEGSDDDEEEEAEPVERQTLVFSATFQKGLQQKLAKRDNSSHDNLLDKKASMEYLLKKLHFRDEKPRFVDVNPVSQMSDNLKEGVVECSAMEKDLYLYS
ncbi:hypothetical protein FQN49_006123, partial [Arthroderma sp. PD_2]